MTIIQQLHALWLEHGLATMNVDGVAISPTFIEEVGSAAAENIRNAALMRWFNANPELGLKWLESLCQSELIHKAPYRVTREHYLDKNNRVDLVVWGSDEVPIAFIEAKWTSPVRHAGQLEVYRTLIDKQYLGAPLIILSPIRHARPILGDAFSVIATTWQDLTNFIQSDTDASTGAESLEADLWRTCLRLNTLEKVLIKGIADNKTLGEFMELHTWLDETKDCDNKSLGYSEFVRQMLLTFLAERLAERLNVSDHTVAWRRSITINGPRKDTQSDICPEKRSDGLIKIDGVTTNMISLVARFHIYPDFANIKVGIGTQISPYRDGKNKANYIAANPIEMQKTAERVFSVRSSLIAELKKGGIFNTKIVQTKKTAWFKEYAPRKFTKSNNVEELLEYGQNLAPMITTSLQRYSRDGHDLKALDNAAS